MIFDTDGQIM